MYSSNHFASGSARRLRLGIIAMAIAFIVPPLVAQSIVLPKKGLNPPQEAYIALDKLVMKMDKGISWYDFAWGTNKVYRAIAKFRATDQAAQMPVFAADLEEAALRLSDLEHLWMAKNADGTDRLYCAVTVENGASCAKWQRFVTQCRNAYSGNLEFSPSLVGECLESRICRSRPVHVQSPYRPPGLAVRASSEIANLTS